MSIPHRYCDFDGRRPYESLGYDEFGCVYHLGQLKLLATEIHFLTKYYKDGMTVLYVGSANGYHITKLAELFPTAKFDLWDPKKFEVKQSDKITLFNHYFTDEIAHKYKVDGKKILLISDIRNMPPTPKGSDEFGNDLERTVDGDMQAQLRWTRIINPVAASLKFRVQYYGKIYYFTGDLWLQTYFPRSTEMRLFTTDYSTVMEYDGIEVDEKMAYFNTNQRCAIYDKWIKVMKKNKIKNVWDNCYFLDILAYYLKMKDKASAENVGNLFMDIIRFMNNRFGAKYNILFDG